jgi:hypothetical protein
MGERIRASEGLEAQKPLLTLSAPRRDVAGATAFGQARSSRVAALARSGTRVHAKGNFET